MNIHIRPATTEDADEIAVLLNEIIEVGGTTAHQTPFTSQRALRHYIAPPLGIACSLAEDQGLLLGFQALEWSDPAYVGPDPLPNDWALIATFARVGRTRTGIGRALFERTLDAAKKANVKKIDATIRADNSGGLAYYSAMGFSDYAVVNQAPLSDGTRVDRIRKRFDIE